MNKIRQKQLKKKSLKQHFIFNFFKEIQRIYYLRLNQHFTEEDLTTLLNLINATRDHNLKSQQQFKHIIQEITNKNNGGNKATFLLKTLEFVNKILESNYDLEVELQWEGLYKQKLLQLKTFHSLIKQEVEKSIKPGSLIIVEEVIQRLLQIKHSNNKMISKNVYKLFKVEDSEIIYRLQKKNYDSIPKSLNSSQVNITKDTNLSRNSLEVKTAQHCILINGANTNVRPVSASINSQITASPIENSTMITLDHNKIDLSTTKEIPYRVKTIEIFIFQLLSKYRYQTSSTDQFKLNQSPPSKNSSRQTKLKKNISFNYKSVEDNNQNQTNLLLNKLMMKNIKIKEGQMEYYNKFKQWATKKFSYYSFMQVKQINNVNKQWALFRKQYDIKINYLINDFEEKIDF